MVQDIKTSKREVSISGIIGIVAVTICTTIFFYFCIYRALITFRTGFIFFIVIFLLIILSVRLYSKTKRTQVILFYYGVYCVISVIAGVKLRQSYEEGQLSIYGRKTFAIVTRLYMSKSRYSSKPKAEFTYRINGLTYTKNTDNKYKNLEINDTVKIVYSSKDPAVFRLFATSKRLVPEANYQNITGNVSISNSGVENGDRLPQFRGGSEALNNYIRNHLVYPSVGIVARRAGKVELSFVIGKDGSLNHIKVEKGIGKYYDEAAIDVIKKSPKWLPGIQNGKAVRVKYNIPIKFTL